MKSPGSNKFVFLLYKAITECPSVNDCDQVCFINQGNSQVCDCLAGYELESNGKTCKDIDECKIDGVKCTQLCKNKDGGYDCQCYPGFELEADGFTCTGNNVGINRPSESHI